MLTTKHTTEWRRYEHGIVRASYGFVYLQGNRRSYFSITCDTARAERIPGEESFTFEGRRYWMDGGGANHELIARVFPELSYLTRWHLVDDTGVPLHYEANARFWLRMLAGEIEHRETDADPAKAFKSTVVWGASEYDEYMPTLDSLGGWLALRLPAVRERFRLDMDLAGVTWLKCSVCGEVWPCTVHLGGAGDHFCRPA